MAAARSQLQAFLQERVYRHRRVVQMDANAQRIVSSVFDEYVKHPKLLPTRFARRIDEQGPYRVVCDYLAGMTDRFCQDEHRRLFGSRLIR